MADARNRRRGPGLRLHHVAFGTALVLLVLIASWWMVFLTRSVQVEDDLQRQRLWLEAALQADALAAQGLRPSVGVLAGQERFEVVRVQGATAGAPIGGTGLGVRPTARTLDTQADRLHRRRLMVFGEGTLLLLLVGACVAMLHRLVVAEQRYRADVEHFLSRVTHEMKTPLAGLKALLQSIRDGQVPADRLNGLVALGLRQAERQEHLIENLLSAHRVAARAVPLPLEELDVATELRSFLEHRRETMAAPDDRYELDCPEGLRARGNAGALVTILENLADNADKYGATCLTLRAHESDDRVLLEVIDDGEGFPTQAAESLFEAFRRGATGTPVARHGTGLGLHIARELAREMQGELRASSEGPGRGATFTLELAAAGAPS